MIVHHNAWLETTRRFDAGWRPKNLLGSENVKLRKSAKKNWRGLGLSLAPANISGWEVCASRSPECTRHCLFTSGRGAAHFVRRNGTHPVWMGRIFRTIWFFKARDEFMDRLVHEIDRNRDAAIRLNVFSDWQWERQRPNLFEAFPEVQFYDYTKHFKRMFRPRPANYHLTFSLHEKNRHLAPAVLGAGMNVAVVTPDPRGMIFGHRVIDGDEHDLRFLDPAPVVVGLRPKGSLRNAGSAFVQVPKAA
jgi:hypothetical protein